MKKLCLICGMSERWAGRLYCKKCNNLEKNYAVMDLDINIHDYPNLFEYKK